MKRLMVCLVALSLAGALSATERDEIYKGRGERDGVPNLLFSLTLSPDGFGEFQTVLRGRRTTTERCRWERKPGELTMQFCNFDNKLRGDAVVWAEARGQLTPLRWSKEEWGESGPPALRGG